MAYESTGIDGHFWVVRNGEIIDTSPEDVGLLKASKPRGLTGKKVYLPASPLIQTIMLKSYTRTVINEYIYITKKFANTVAHVYENSPPQAPKPNCCYANAFYEQWKNGGTVVFGSQGYLADWTDETFWECGGPDFVLSDFLGKTTEKREKYTEHCMTVLIHHLMRLGLSREKIQKRISLCCESDVGVNYQEGPLNMKYEAPPTYEAPPNYEVPPPPAYKKKVKTPTYRSLVLAQA